MKVGIGTYFDGFSGVRASFLCGPEKEKRWAVHKRITAFQEANKYGTSGPGD